MMRAVSFDLGPLQLWPKVVIRPRMRVGPVVYKRGLGRLTLPPGWGEITLLLLVHELERRQCGVLPGIMWQGPWGRLELRIRRRASCPS